METAQQLGEQIALIFNNTSEEVGEYISVFWIALLAPLASALFRKKIPDVVFLLIFGMIIGPNMVGLASDANGVHLLKELGLGLLFLLAGYEINPSTLKSKQGRSAMISWIFSFALGLLVAGLIVGFNRGFDVLVTLALAMSSTALGTLLPLIKTHGKTGTKLGDAVMVHGAIGELFPIFAMSLLLSTHSTLTSVLILLSFMIIAVVAAVVPHRLFENIPGLRRVMAAEANTTSQTMLRLAMLLLTTLMMAAAVFELDVVLGAFAAGFILRSLTPNGAVEPFTKRLEALGFSFLIPLFFVASGMGINVRVALEQPLVLLAIVAGILVIRGLPVFLLERFTSTDSGLKTTNEKVQLGLYSAAGLPIIVAVTEVALSYELISATAASLLVMAGALTVLLFPIWAKTVDALFASDSEAGRGEPTTAQKIQAKKSERSKASKIATSTLPVIGQQE